MEKKIEKNYRKLAPALEERLGQKVIGRIGLFERIKLLGYTGSDSQFYNIPILKESQVKPIEQGIEMPGVDRKLIFYPQGIAIQVLRTLSDHGELPYRGMLTIEEVVQDDEWMQRYETRRAPLYGYDLGKEIRDDLGDWDQRG